MNFSSVSLPEVLVQQQATFAEITPFNLNVPNVLVLDLSANNKDLATINLANTASFEAYIWKEMNNISASVAVGGYNEDRIIYGRSENFSGAENRSVHLGIDIWVLALTPVYCPLAGVIHSFQNNIGFGNYGPTIIIEHMLKGVVFYTLYGHLSVTSIENCKVGRVVKAGEQIGSLGNYPENGDWPPHLHFQIIRNLHNWSGDFPGVAAPGEREYYLQLCPDPNLILQIKSLQNKLI